jgi:leader peptidase (prepilin peptidase)/N-methyltransferase
MNFLIILIFFAFGTIIGSFLNVVIYRTNTGKSLLGRSACMSCKKRLAWYELVPIFSFIFLNGRCGHCKTRISYQYVLVEFLTGLVFALIYLKFF